MKLLFFLLRQSRSIVIWAIVIGVLSGIANTLLIVLVHDLITQGGMGRSALVLSFLALWIGLPLTRLVSEVLLAHLSQKAIFDLRLHMCWRILDVPLRRLEEIGSPRLLASLTDDIGAITNSLGQIPLATIQLTVVLGCLLYMGWLSLLLVLAVVGFIAVGILAWQFVARRAGGLLLAAREQQDALFDHFRAVTQGVKELKLHRARRTAFMSDLLQTTAHEYRRLNVFARAFFSGGGAFLQLLYFGSFGLLLLFVPAHAGVDRSVLTGFTLVLLYLVAPLDYLIGISTDIGRAGVALGQVEKLGLSLEGDASERGAPGDEGPPHPWRRLELKGVTHTYHREHENSTFILGPVDVAFEAGELIFITGGNGSGKTTLGKLITGLYLPESGCLQVDGVPVSAANRETYRNLFSVVFSDFFLFDRMLGLESPEVDARTREYLEKLRLDKKVEVRDGRLSTIELSQGQRKRLALLTAYMEDRPVYLFDEWAADQDPEFKHVFYDRLLAELKARRKTVFVISHDDAYFHLADRILKLEDGRVGTATLENAGTARSTSRSAV
jgi:putative ATP-binding cassette transporter